MTPTTELYQSLEKIFEFFNAELFDGQLPSILFTVQRKARTMSYFTPDRWVSVFGEQCHELAYNPLYVTDKSIVEVLQTLVHELVHCWQHCHGAPSRSGYHNAEWANKMESIGLMPSSTGKPEGKRTGQHMSDYLMADGRFINACQKLIKDEGVGLPWFDRFAQPTSGAEKITQSFLSDTGIKDSDVIEALTAPFVEPAEPSGTAPAEESQAPVAKPTNRKIKYSCNQCGVNVWGKPDLKLKCGECDVALKMCIK